MYINYINDRKELGFQATHDSKAADQVDLIVKITGFWIVITFSRINAQGSDEQFLVSQSYSAIPAQKIIKKSYLLDQNDQQFDEIVKTDTGTIVAFKKKAETEDIILIKDDPSFGVHGLQPSTSRFWPRKSGQCGKPPSAGRPNPFQPGVNPYRTAPNVVDQGVGAAANPAGAGNEGGDAPFDESCPVPKTGKKSNQFQNPTSLNQSKKNKKKKNSRAVSRTRVNEAYQDFISEMNQKGYKVNISEDRFAELSINPQTREFDEQSISEAYGTLELELKNMIKNLRRTKNPDVDLDFMAERVGSGETIFLDHKEMIDFESLSDRGIDVSYFPSHEEVAFKMGKDSVEQKQTFLGKDQGPTSMEEVVHVFNFRNIRDRTGVPLLIQEVLNGAEEAGYTDGMMFLNYQ